MLNGAIIDLETTGLDAQSDEIIEIGIIEFAAPEADPLQLEQMHSWLNQPSHALDEAIVNLTGISDAIVAGKQIPWKEVEAILSGKEIIVAHNAGFDKGFLKHQSPLPVDDFHWACSALHIDWKKHGHKTRALNYLACDEGFINPFPHRALFDCATTFNLIKNRFSELYAQSKESYFLIKAIKAPFESKDILKGRGYRWNPEERCWQTVIAESKMPDEEDFLNQQVYGGRTSPHISQPIVPF